MGNGGRVEGAGPGAPKPQPPSAFGSNAAVVIVGGRIPPGATLIQTPKDNVKNLPPGWKPVAGLSRNFAGKEWVCMEKPPEGVGSAGAVTGAAGQGGEVTIVDLPANPPDISLHDGSAAAHVLHQKHESSFTPGTRAIAQVKVQNGQIISFRFEGAPEWHDANWQGKPGAYDLRSAGGKPMQVADLIPSLNAPAPQPGRGPAPKAAVAAATPPSAPPVRAALEGDALYSAANLPPGSVIAHENDRAAGIRYVRVSIPADQVKGNEGKATKAAQLSVDGNEAKAMGRPTSTRETTRAGKPYIDYIYYRPTIPNDLI